MNEAVLTWIKDQHDLYEYWVKAGPGGNGWACYVGHKFKSKENYIKVRDWLAELIRSANEVRSIEHRHGFPCGICGAETFDDAGNLCKGCESCPGVTMSKEVFG